MIEGLIKFTDRRIFSLPCVKGCGSPVETSAFNAEAPTEPAGETVGCRRQLGGIVRLILYEFVKSLSHFFVPKKRQLPLQGSLCRTTARAVPTGQYIFSIRAKHQLLFTLHYSLFTLLCPSGLTTDIFSNRHSRRRSPRRPLDEASRFAYSFRRTQTLPILCRFCLRPCGILLLTGRGFGARHSRPPSPISDFLQARLFDRRLRPCPSVFALHIRISFQT